MHGMKITVVGVSLLAMVGCNPNELIPAVIVGPDTGIPSVRTLNVLTKKADRSFDAFDKSFAGGVRVAVGDVNGDGAFDMIAAAGPGVGPHVKVFSGRDQSELMSFFALPADFRGGLFVAAGDVNGDGRADVVIGADAGGGPNVRVFDGGSGALISNFFAFDAGFTGGVRVAAGDVNGDGKADIMVGTGSGNAPAVSVFNGADQSLLVSLFAFDVGFTGGVFVAAGDVNGDGRADIIAGAGPGGAPQVVVFDGATGEKLHSFLAFDASFTGGVRVAAGDVNVDGKADIIAAAGPGNGPHIRIFDAVTLDSLGDFSADDSDKSGGAFVAFLPPSPAATAAAQSVLAGLFNRPF